jgi:hypothetical protein
LQEAYAFLNKLEEHMHRQQVRETNTVGNDALGGLKSFGAFPSGCLIFFVGLPLCCLCSSLTFQNFCFPLLGMSLLAFGVSTWPYLNTKSRLAILAVALVMLLLAIAIFGCTWGINTLSDPQNRDYLLN